jgi:hypothetical protein
MPDIAEMDSYAMLCQDWGSAYRITRTPDPRRLPGPPCPPGGSTVTSPVLSAPTQPPGPAEPGTVSQPRHRMHALTTYELRDYRRQLETAIAFFDRQDPVPTARRRLQTRLDEVLTEQEDRRKLADARP